LKKDEREEFNAAFQTPIIGLLADQHRHRTSNVNIMGVLGAKKVHPGFHDAHPANVHTTIDRSASGPSIPSESNNPNKSQFRLLPLPHWRKPSIAVSTSAPASPSQLLSATANAKSFLSTKIGASSSGFSLRGSSKPDRFYRHNGWTRPLHPLQLLAIIIFSLLVLVHFVVLLPRLPVYGYVSYASVWLMNALLFALHAILHVRSLTIDPADPAVIARRKQVKQQSNQLTVKNGVNSSTATAFSDGNGDTSPAHKNPGTNGSTSVRPSYTAHSQFCYICESVVGGRSKHCSACNKCVHSFDHHCKWLNNCVGGQNYR
jgi:hypothetical protein